MSTVLLVVPTPEAEKRLLIDRKSAIVRPPCADESSQVTIYYEGNRFSASNLTRYEGRVLCASGRLLENYPTSAKCRVDQKDLITVGSARRIKGYGIFITEISDPKRLAAWLDDEPLPQINGSEDMRSLVAAKAMRAFGQHELVKMTMKAQSTGTSLTDLYVNRVFQDA